MNNLLRTIIMITALVSTISAAKIDDPLNYKIAFDELQMKHNNRDNTFEWSMNTWIGYDLNKVYLYSEGEIVNDNTESENELVWSNAISPYWDIQYGFGVDQTEENNKKWAVLAFSGMSPYFFNIRNSILIDDVGNIGIRLNIENEYSITKRLLININSEINAYTKDNNKYDIEQGFSTLSLGANLKYEVIKEFVPYIGIVHDETFGTNSSTQTSFITGVSIWF